MSVFNPEAFLTQQETGALSTKFEPVPDGEYPAMIGADENSVKARTTASGRAILDVTWEINDPDLASRLGKDRITIRQSVFLDLTPQGTLDRAKGKNVQLGRLRDALGQNDPSRPWSPLNLRGAGPAKIRVTSRSGDDDTIYNDVKGVAKMA